MLTHSSKPTRKLSEEELAYEILATQGRPMYYKDLIREVLERQNRPLEPNTISSTLTQINLDARFVYVSNGEWGLKVWVPKKSSRRTPKIALLSKKSDSDN
ncbi:MAG: DNA-directed RNA polymerase subunit delta [Desulfitobacterium sp.]|nr:DNA-directed RNA polymerase subunit delta [Desulfitobacterium sp.]